MIRPMTLVCLTLAAILGFALFKVKHEVQILETELTQIHRAILTDQESIHVLNAEWSYLNRPRHLQKLNALVKEPVDLGSLGSNFESMVFWEGTFFVLVVAVAVSGWSGQ